MTAVSDVALLSLTEYDIEPDTSITITTDDEGEPIYFHITPEYTETYTFKGVHKEGWYGLMDAHLYDSDMNELASYSSGSDHGFTLTYTLEAGKSYIWMAQYSAYDITGTFEVTLTAHHDMVSEVIMPNTCKDGVVTYTCNICGKTSTEVLPAEHNFVNDVCTMCGADWYACGSCGDDAYWYLNHEGLLTISGEGEMWFLEEPESAPWYAERSRITDVVIDNGIVTIGHYSFYSCNNLVNVTIPESLTSIPDLAFARCSSLTSITIPGSVQTIGDYAFSQSHGLKNVTISEGVETISEAAFNECTGLTNVLIPSTVANIDTAPFMNCTNLQAIQVHPDNKHYCNDEFGVLYTRDQTTLIQAPMTLAGSYSIADAAVDIGKFAFYNCSNLTDVTLSASTTNIGLEAFDGCNSLRGFWVHEDNPEYSSDEFGVLMNKDKTELILAPVKLSGIYTPPDTTTKISNGAFAYNTALKGITIPASVVTIEGGAFSSSRLNWVVFKGDAPELNNQIFFNVIANVYYPAGNETWTSDVMLDYGGTITWKEYVFEFVSQPQTVHADVGETAVLEVLANSADCTYQWYYSDDGETWTACEGETDYCLTMVISDSSYGKLYRCEAVAADGTVIVSETAEIKDSSITVGEPVTVSIKTGGEYAYFPFTPAYTESFTFFSSGGSDTYGYLYDSEMNQLTYNDDGGEGRNFSITYTLEAGKTYIWAARYYSSSATGTFTVTLLANHQSSNGTVTKPATCTENGEIRYICDNCGTVYTEVIPAAHSWDEGQVTQEATCTEDGVLTYTCTVCAETSTESIAAAHNYVDGVCGTCGDDRRILTEGSYIAEIVNSGDYAYFWFTPAYTESYTFAASSDGADTCGYLYDSEMNQLAYNDDSNDRDFAITYTPEAGKTYIWGARYYYSGTTGSFVVTLTAHHQASTGTVITPATCTEDGLMSCICEICGASFNKVVPAAHNFVDGVCIACGRAIEILASGNCGENVTWTLDETGTMTIAGTGAMTDYEDGTAVPWTSQRDQITSVVILDGVTTLGDYSFYYCSNLTSAVIGDDVTIIGDAAFCSCSKLTDLTIGQSVERIAPNAFSTCKMLCDVQLPDSLIYLDNYAFVDCSAIQHIELPNNLNAIGYSAFYGCEQLEEITIPDSVSSISSYAFAYCDSLESVTIPNSVQYFGEYVFTSCASLTSIELPDSVTQITVGMFYACEGLTNVVIPDSVTKIKEHAFEGCTALESIEIPDGVTDIGYEAFRDCTALTSIAIPENVTSISDYAFAYCTSLNVIRFAGDAPSINESSFYLVEAAAYYPVENETWTEDVMQQYGGTITWESYTVYEVIEEGTDDTVVAGEPLDIHVDADHNELTAVYMDGELVVPSNYTVTEGSTIITFKPEFLATLGEGDHKVTVEFESGMAFTTITVPDEPLPEYIVTFISASISLAGDIGINFYTNLSDDIVADENAYMQFAVADEIQIVPLSEAWISTDSNGVKTYRFSAKVAAKQMTETVTAQMYLSDGTAVDDSKAYSVKAYCDAAITTYGDNAAYADQVELMKAMLNYGGYSQIQFGYNTGNLANANLEDTSLPEITAADVSAYAHGATGSEEGISVASVSLLLESTTTIRFYFNVEDGYDISSYTFYVDGAETTPVESGENQYYVDKVNVAAKDLDKMVTVTVGGLTAHYCGLSYVRQVAVQYPTYYNEKLVNVVRALYAYNQAANTYFEN